MFFCPPKYQLFNSQIDRFEAPMIISIVITLTILLNGIHCDVQFQYDSEQCLNQPVEYQCTVTGSGTNVLIWSAYTDNGTQITGSPHTYVSITIGTSVSIGGVFTVEQLSPPSPLISNISFTVQSSIDGYTISCQDGNTLDNENITINIQGPPPPPMDIKLSVNTESVRTSWTPPNITSQCVNVSSYSITSNATNSTITTTDTSVDIPLAGLSPGVYCVSVATVDTANRTGEYSNEECVTLQVPPCANITCEYFNHSENSSMAICQLHWEFTPSSIPPLQWVYIYNNVTGNTVRVSGNLESEQITIMRGQHHMFSVFGENVIGNGTTCDSSEITAFVDTEESLPIISPTATTSSPLLSMDSTLSTSTSMNTTSNTTILSVPSEEPPVVVIIVICVITLICIAVLVVMLLICFLYIKRKKKRDRGVEPERSNKTEKEDNIKDPTSDVPTTMYNDVFLNQRGSSTKKSDSRNKKKEESPPKPQPYGKSQQVSYSAGKQEVHYAEMSHHSQNPQQHGARGAGGKVDRSPPHTSVVYSDIKHH